jgi:hypothetical protein
MAADAVGHGQQLGVFAGGIAARQIETEEGVLVALSFPADVGPAERFDPAPVGSRSPALTGPAGMEQAHCSSSGVVCPC